MPVAEPEAAVAPLCHQPRVTAGSQKAHQHGQSCQQQGRTAALPRLVAGVKRDACDVQPHASRQQPLVWYVWPTGRRHTQKPIERAAASHRNGPPRRELGVTVVRPHRCGKASAHKGHGRLPRDKGCSASTHAADREESIGHRGSRLDINQSTGQRTLWPLGTVEFQVQDIVEHHASTVKTNARSNGPPQRRGWPLECLRLRYDQEASQHVGNSRRIIRQSQQSQPCQQECHELSRSPRRPAPHRPVGIFWRRWRQRQVAGGRDRVPP